jgi:hypothetical protein
MTMGMRPASIARGSYREQYFSFQVNSGLSVVVAGRTIRHSGHQPPADPRHPDFMSARP